MRVSVLAGVGAGLIAVAVTVQAQTTGVREVTASARSLIQLHTKLRYTTMVVLPDDEEILDVVCGDKDFWVISASQNIAHVKPAKEGAATNLNLVTASGTVYSFLLAEEHATQPDLKVYVTADEVAARGKPKYYSAGQVTALQSELTDTRAAVQLARHESDQAIADHVCALLDDRAERLRIRAAARWLLQGRYTAAPVMARMMDVYDEVARGT
jgi:SpoU rRNA methylase family enzyme